MPARAASDEEAPRYRRVKDFITERVLSGDWPSGQRVPSENELTAQFGVSRMTVNRALRELTAEGWLTRVQGAGSFVAEQKPQSALLEVRNIRTEIMARGHRHSADLIALDSQPATREVAQALEVRAGSRVFHSLLVHRENGVPVQLEERHVNPLFAPRYQEQDFTRLTPYEYLTAVGPIAEAEHIIEAVEASAEVCRYLELRHPEPCLRLTRRTWSNGLVATRARLTHPGSRFRFFGRQDYAPGHAKLANL
jgi:GntR family histidine utilization transcriptional repressor